MRIFFYLIILLTFAIAGCTGKSRTNAGQNSDSTNVVSKDSIPDEQLIADAKMILLDFKNKEYNKLAEYVGPQGVRFSPYAFIDTSKDVVLTAQQIRNAATSSEKLLWGEYDGSGEPIKMSIEQYFSTFVCSTDFSGKGEISVNTISQKGNTTNNIREAYPGCKWVEFFIKGEKPEFDGMDWSALRLVFLQAEGKAWLVGVVHDQWTI